MSKKELKEPFTKKFEQLKFIKADLSYVLREIAEYEMINNKFKKEREKKNKIIKELKNKLKTIKSQIPDFDIKLYKKYHDYFNILKEIKTLMEEEGKNEVGIKARLEELNVRKESLISMIKSMEDNLGKDKEEFIKILSSEQEVIKKEFSKNKQLFNNCECKIEEEQTKIEKLKMELKNIENELRKIEIDSDVNKENIEKLQEQIRHKHFFINDSFEKINKLMEEKHKLKCEIYHAEKQLKLQEDQKVYLLDRENIDAEIKK